MSNLSGKISILTYAMLHCIYTFGKSNDTISYWHIDFNETTALELSGEGHELKINRDTLNEESLIGFKYWPGCLVCHDCITHIGIYTKEKKLIQREDAKGTWTPIVVSFREILLETYTTGETTFDCYYLEGNELDASKAIHLLRIQLE